MTKKISKPISISQELIDAVEKYANENFDGNFSMASCKLIEIGLKS